MPELPEVETTRRGIAPLIEGRSVSAVVIRESRLRWPVPGTLPKRLARRKLLKVERRAKYLLLRFTHGTLILHLGMSGSLRVLPENTPPGRHDHFDLVFGDRCLRLRDPRRFGAVLWMEEDPCNIRYCVPSAPNRCPAIFTGSICIGFRAVGASP